MADLTVAAETCTALHSAHEPPDGILSNFPHVSTLRPPTVETAVPSPKGERRELEHRASEGAVAQNRRR